MSTDATMIQRIFFTLDQLKKDFSWQSVIALSFDSAFANSKGSLAPLVVFVIAAFGWIYDSGVPADRV